MENEMDMESGQHNYRRQNTNNGMLSKLHSANFDGTKAMKSFGHF